MNTLDFKIEAKWGWYRVDLESGEYSDYSITTIIVAANSPEEVWERIKQLYDAKQLPHIMSGIASGTLADSHEAIRSDQFGEYPVGAKYADVNITISMVEVYYFKK